MRGETDMEEVRKLLSETLNEDLIQIVLSNTRDSGQASKAKIRPVRLKGQLLFQETLYRGAQVFHKNMESSEAAERIAEHLQTLFRQGEWQTLSGNATVLVGKKGNVTVKKRRKPGNQDAGNATAEADGQAGVKGAAQENPCRTFSHNRAKQYILKEGQPVDFLVSLGVQSPEGRIVKAKYDKFRQINRYLEFIEDVLEELPQDRPIRIIDFGCGKSYLTFAMYYYLHELQGREIQVTGLDLKETVIAHCNELAQRLGYEHLHFERGDIRTYEGETTVDMVVSLHACDTATDYALEKAVKWNAGVIMAVPCCQHELNRQISCEILKPVLRYGVIRERMAALLTDALRANLLERQGYDTQILEFIDMEHTPKNLLIRAVKRKGMQPAGKRGDIGKVEAFLQVSPTLERLLEE